MSYIIKDITDIYALFLPSKLKGRILEPFSKNEKKIQKTFSVVNGKIIIEKQKLEKIVPEKVLEEELKNNLQGVEPILLRALVLDYDNISDSYSENRFKSELIESFDNLYSSIDFLLSNEYSFVYLKTITKCFLDSYFSTCLHLINKFEFIYPEIINRFKKRYTRPYEKYKNEFEHSFERKELNKLIKETHINTFLTWEKSLIKNDFLTKDKVTGLLYWNGKKGSHINLVRFYKFLDNKNVLVDSNTKLINLLETRYHISINKKTRQPQKIKNTKKFIEKFGFLIIEHPLNPSENKSDRYLFSK